MKTTTTIPIRSFHTDCFGHVHHARYVELLEESRWCYMENNPAVAAALKREGIHHAVVHLEIRYHGEAQLGDRIRVETWVQNAGRHTVTMRQALQNQRSGKEVLTADVTNLFYLGKVRNKVRTSDAVFKCWDDLQAVIGKQKEALEL
jgi:thioesterase-3